MTHTHNLNILYILFYNVSKYITGSEIKQWLRPALKGHLSNEPMEATPSPPEAGWTGQRCFQKKAYSLDTLCQEASIT